MRVSTKPKIYNNWNSRYNIVIIILIIMLREIN